MRQVLYGNNSLSLIPLEQIQVDQPAVPAKPGAGQLVRWIARRWDLVGVLALIGSSAAYAVYAMMHLGL